MQIAVHRLRKIIKFGTVKSVEDDNTGDYTTEFVTNFTRHFGYYQRTQTQTYQLLKTDLEDTIVIVIRHTDKVTKQLRVQFDGDASIYIVADISSGSTGLPIDYDLVTLRLSTKVG